MDGLEPQFFSTLELLAAGDGASGVWHLFFQVFALVGGAFVLGAIAQRLKQSPIIGYLLAGILLGPYTLGGYIFKLIPGGEPLTATQIFQFAELGVALLLFYIGLEFSLRKLKALGSMALIGGTCQVLFTLAVVTLIATPFFGGNVKPALALGGMVALSSTACVLGILKERGIMDASFSRNSLGILLLQDIAVVPLVLMVTMLNTGGTGMEVAKAIATTIAMAGLLFVLFWLIFNVIVPWALLKGGISQNRELVVLLAVAAAIGASWGAHALGLSAALGAFLAGILLGESKFAVQIRADVGPLKTLFMTLFFGAIGMMLNPVWIISDFHWAKIIIFVIGSVAIKVLVIAIVVKMLKRPWSQSFATAVILAQIGEFSFVLAKIAYSGGEGGLIDKEQFNLIVSATIATLVITPYLINLTGPITGTRTFFGKIPKNANPDTMKAIDTAPLDTDGEDTDVMLEKFKVPDEQTVAEHDDHVETIHQVNNLRDVMVERKPNVLIVGFGPAGSRIAETLLRLGIKPHVIEMNPKTARAAQLYDLEVHIGNASQVEVLEHAKVDEADFIIITLPDSGACRHVIEQAIAFAPKARIIARSRYHVFRWELEMAGAHLVVDEEEQVGLRIASELFAMIQEDCGMEFPEIAKIDPTNLPKTNES